MGKTDTDGKTTITPTTRPIKHPVRKSPTKIRSKDKRSPTRPPISTDFSPNKKRTPKDKQKSIPKPKIQETDTIKYKKQNKFRILEKMETESSSPQLSKPKRINE